MTRTLKIQVLDAETGRAVYEEAMQMPVSESVSPTTLTATIDAVGERLVRQVLSPPPETRRDLRMVDFPCGGCDRVAGFSTHVPPPTLPRGETAVDSWVCAFCGTKNVIPLTTDAAR